MKREDILRRPAYWFEHEQNELYRQVIEYMERENINRTELANRLNVHKSYVSQILNGNFNYTLKKWIELCLAIGVVPGGYKKIEDVIKEDVQFAQAKKDVFEKKTEIPSTMKIIFSNVDKQHNEINILSGDFPSTTIEQTSQLKAAI
jgi:transcriptional regulator with XRE-family HTH domain